MVFPATKFKNIKMKKITLLIAVGILAMGSLQAQRLSAHLQTGVANYNGDLQEKRFTFQEAKPFVGLGLSYEITPKLFVRGMASYIRLSAADANNSKLISERNLSFKTRVWEAQLGLEYQLFDLDSRSFTPYVFAGVAAYHYKPYANDSAGNKVYLQPLGTEGQGLAAYPDKKIYNTKQIAIPFGGGVKLALTDKLQLGLEVGLRKLFTDYLDDVSGTYADSATLFAGRGAQAVQFAFRSNQVKAGAIYPAVGTLRGNPKVKDWYYTTGIRIIYRLGGGNGSGRNSKTGCPTNIY